MSYTYLLYHKSTKMFYVGVRFAKNAAPEDFWATYFTSSSIVHKLIDCYGIEDFRFKIISIFNNSQDAILQEAKFLKKAIKKKNYLNANAGGFPRNDICVLAGKIGGIKQKLLKIGIHAQTKEERLVLSSKGGKKSCLVNGWKDPKQQSERGKKGGVKNKGFIWYNDGKKSFKYTTNEQHKLNFDEFITNNCQYNVGRLENNYSKGKIWVNDGLNNYMIFEKNFSEKYSLGRLGNKEKYNGHKNRKINDN